MRQHSPLTSALKHVALAQANFLEHIARRDQQEPTQTSQESTTSTIMGNSTQRFRGIGPKSTFNSSSSLLTQIPPDFLGGQVRHKADAQRRDFTSTSKVKETDSHTFDWDDPVIAGSPISNAQSFASDDSDLPDLDFVGHPSRQTVKTQPVKTPLAADGEIAGPKRRGPLQPIRVSAAQVLSSKSGFKKAQRTPEDYALMRAQGKQREAIKMAREAEKEKQKERLKEKYPQFSYDKGNGITPKVWYFREKGLRSEFLGCDVREGTASPDEQSLEAVIMTLEG